MGFRSEHQFIRGSEHEHSRFDPAVELGLVGSPSLVVWDSGGADILVVERPTDIVLLDGNDLAIPSPACGKWTLSRRTTDAGWRSRTTCVTTKAQRQHHGGRPTATVGVVVLLVLLHVIQTDASSRRRPRPFRRRGAQKKSIQSHSRHLLCQQRKTIPPSSYWSTVASCPGSKGQGTDQRQPDEHKEGTDVG